jgi:transcriptional regulator GlxA family with amidase domain
VWIQENLHRDLTLEQLAARAGLSLRSLHRRFKEQTATTPAGWVTTARIRKAHSGSKAARRNALQRFDGVLG